MILAFNLADIIQVPFGYLMELLYELNQRGCHLPLDAITVDECADAIMKELG